MLCQENYPVTKGLSWRQNCLLGLLLVVVTLIAYGPALTAGFIWDDDEYLTNNPKVKTLEMNSAEGLRRLWFASSTADYYPMTYTLWLLERRLWADDPPGYHFVNILLHGFSAVILWRVFQR